MHAMLAGTTLDLAGNQGFLTEKESVVDLGVGSWHFAAMHRFLWLPCGRVWPTCRPAGLSPLSSVGICGEALAWACGGTRTKVTYRPGMQGFELRWAPATQPDLLRLNLTATEFSLSVCGVHFCPHSSLSPSVLCPFHPASSAKQSKVPVLWEALGDLQALGCFSRLSASHPNTHHILYDTV